MAYDGYLPYVSLFTFVDSTSFFSSTQLVFYQERRGVCSLHNLILPVVTQFAHTLSRVPEGGMVGMGCQDEMVEMESQEDKDHLAHKVY